MWTAVPVEQAFFITPLEDSHPPRAETWLVCHVALWLKLITRMHGIQSEASEGCHREIGRISNASSEIQRAGRTFCTQLTYCKCQYKFKWITAPYVKPAGVGQSCCFLVFFADGQAPLIRRHGAGPSCDSADMTQWGGEEPESAEKQIPHCHNNKSGTEKCFSWASQRRDGDEALQDEALSASDYRFWCKLHEKWEV